MTGLGVLQQVAGQIWGLKQSGDSVNDSKGSRKGLFLWSNQNGGYGVLTRGTPGSEGHEGSQLHVSRYFPGDFQTGEWLPELSYGGW